ncbi:BON domain-containing protein [Lamprobacter modestohalophilus]|uniref:BON domain-containing protein n=1 Tax=Lamprobacter modestohalophilus TaxID=1064514 RepID=UPI002ADEDCFD|nr:BON domain-containing protein [Lamprobacter modestohalophilus]MEA1048562.1 BON domain-containing protein [Lamprobacter modestohalophilus]
MPLLPAPNLIRVLLIASAIGLTPLLQGCAPAAVVGTAYGASVLHERRSASTVLDDEMIEIKAKHRFYQTPEVEQASRISITSYNYQVLLTGQADSAEVKRRFAEIVSQLPKVTKVYDEVHIGPPISLTQESQDALISSRAKIAIGGGRGVKGFDATRVKIVTEDGIVYLMGLVTREEADTTTEVVRRLPGVVRVVKLFEYIEPKSPSSSPSATDSTAQTLTDGA